MRVFGPRTGRVSQSRTSAATGDPLGTTSKPCAGYLVILPGLSLGLSI